MIENELKTIRYLPCDHPNDKNYNKLNLVDIVVKTNRTWLILLLYLILILRVKTLQENNNS